MKEGQKVVCIDDSAPWFLRRFYSHWIKQGTTYVIRGVFLGVDYQTASPGEVGVYLLGIHNPKSSTPPFPERGFNAMRFRPIEERPLRAREEAPELEEVAARSKRLAILRDVRVLARDEDFVQSVTRELEKYAA